MITQRGGYRGGGGSLEREGCSGEWKEGSKNGDELNGGGGRGAAIPDEEGSDRCNMCDLCLGKCYFGTRENRPELQYRN